MHPSQTYPSDLTDREWKLLEPLIPKPKSSGRPIKHPRRIILNAIFFLNRSGCQWDMLPKDFPPKSTVFAYFSAWRQSGLWEKLNHALRVQVRVAEGRQPSPTAAILDSQSVKAAEQGGLPVGYDAGKKMGGRKRHLLVDTLGLILGLGVTSAAVQDRDAAAALLSVPLPPLGQTANHLGRWRLRRGLGRVGQRAAPLRQTAPRHRPPQRRRQRLPIRAQALDPRAHLPLALQVPPPLPR